MLIIILRGKGVDTIQTKQKRVAREHRNKCQPRTENRNNTFQSDTPAGWRNLMPALKFHIIWRFVIIYEAYTSINKRVLSAM